MRSTYFLVMTVMLVTLVICVQYFTSESTSKTNHMFTRGKCNQTWNVKKYLSLAWRVFDDWEKREKLCILTDPRYSPPQRLSQVTWVSGMLTSFLFCAQPPFPALMAPKSCWRHVQTWLSYSNSSGTRAGSCVHREASITDSPALCVNYRHTEQL